MLNIIERFRHCQDQYHHCAKMARYWRSRDRAYARSFVGWARGQKRFAFGILFGFFN